MAHPNAPHAFPTKTFLFSFSSLFLSLPPFVVFFYRLHIIFFVIQDVPYMCLRTHSTFEDFLSPNVYVHPTLMCSWWALRAHTSFAYWWAMEYTQYIYTVYSWVMTPPHPTPATAQWSRSNTFGAPMYIGKFWVLLLFYSADSNSSFQLISDFYSICVIYVQGTECIFRQCGSIVHLVSILCPPLHI